MKLYALLPFEREQPEIRCPRCGKSIVWIRYTQPLSGITKNVAIDLHAPTEVRDGIEWFRPHMWPCEVVENKAARRKPRRWPTTRSTAPQ